MYTTRNILFALFLMLLMAACGSSDAPTSWSLTSLDGKVNFNLELKNGQLFYVLQSDGQTVLDSSRLGAVREDTDLSQGLKFIKASAVENLDNTVNLFTGKQLTIQEKGKVQAFTFENEDGNFISIACRIFNDGIAIRYVFPENTGDKVVLKDDLLEYNVPSGAKAWIQPYDEVTKWTPGYEKFYENGFTPGLTGRYGNGWCYPALFNLNQKWMLLSEAGIDGNFVGTHLDSKEGSSTFTLRWPEKTEARGLGEQLPSGTLPWQTSWKTIAVGDLNTIVKSDIPKLVSPANRITDTSWIKPGRASWSWLSDHDSPQDYDKLVKFIDFSVEMGWEYSLVDANWDRMNGGNIQQLVDYANEKGVGILMWYNSGGDHNEVDEAPRDIMSDSVRRKEEFKKLQFWGVKGIKVDFFQSDKQFIMKQYKGILEDAAKYQILVNFHGCTVPRGWSRTYPNLLTMESVRGGESYTFARGFGEQAPQHNTIIPFTRNVVGSMDYTPVIFQDMTYPHLTTNSHELALSVVFESGWLHFGDGIEGYKSLGELETNFLKSVPVTWDEVKLLSGTPGKDVVIARRKGADWYIGGLNGESIEKDIQVDLSFLEGSYKLLKMVDGQSSRLIDSEESKFEGNMNIHILPYGGFTLKLTKV